MQTVEQFHKLAKACREWVATDSPIRFPCRTGKRFWQTLLEKFSYLSNRPMLHLSNSAALSCPRRHRPRLGCLIQLWSACPLAGAFRV